MDAEVKNHFMNEESGQSLLEVMFLVPFLFMFVVILYKFMMVVQISIANTQYARSQIYMLTANSPEYPRLQLRDGFPLKKQDRMVLGVADPSGVKQDDKIDPIPQIQKVGRLGTTKNGSSDTGEVKYRTEIRVRNTSAICTQLNGIPNGTNERWPFKREVCRYEGIL